MARKYDIRKARRKERWSGLATKEVVRSKAVLLVADKGPVRQSVVQVLREGGYHVLEASGALDAQRLADEYGDIRLLLADFSTPKSTGLELARWFQGRFPETKILITASSLWDLLCQTGDHENFGILLKPFSDDELRRMVRRLASDG